MKRINAYEFYELGIGLHPLASMQGEVTLTFAYWPLQTAEGWLNRLLAGQFTELNVSRPAAEDLLNQIQSMTQSYFYKEGAEVGAEREFDAEKDWSKAVIPSWETDWLSKKAVEFEHIFAAELRASAMYAVPDVGIFKTSGLVDKAEDHIPAELRALMNETAVEDFRAAGKCLAFGLSTACGFHTLRAVEIVLMDYYKIFAGSEAKEFKSWFDYIEAVGKLSDEDADPKPSKRTVRDLDQLRDLDRNPIMHPREFLTPTQARGLFNNGISAIMSMTTEMREAKDKQPQAGLGLVQNGESEKSEVANEAGE